MKTEGHRPASEYERLKSVARSWISQIWQERDLDAVDRLHAVGFVDRSPAGRDTGRDAYKAGIAALFEAFPNFYTEIEDLVVDASRGKVAIRWTATGTFEAQFLGFEPTKQSVAFRGIEIIKVTDDQIAERWGEWGGLDLMAQLGASPPGG